jgi:hypothetical protein
MPTFAEMTEIANALGHSDMNVRKSNRGYHGLCSCGFTTHRQGTEAVALTMLVGHVRKAVLDFIRSGRSLESVRRASTETVSPSA